MSIPVGEANSASLLLTSLRDCLREAFADMVFPSPGREDAEPLVYIHGMPDEGKLDLYPFLLVRWMSREMRSEPDHKTSLIDEVGIVCGANSPEGQEQAGLILAEMSDRVCWALWSARLLASRFELVEPLEVTLPSPDLKVHRFHMSTVISKWQYNWPPKGLREEFLLNGVIQK